MTEFCKLCTADGKKCYIIVMVSLKKFSFLIFLSIFLISLLTIFLFPSPSEAAIGDNEMVSAQYGNGNAETKSLSDWAKAHCQGKPSSCTRAFIDGFNQKYDGTTNRDKYCDGIDNKSDNCEKPYDAGAQLATAVTRVHLSKINDKKKGEIIAKYCEAYKNQSSGSAKEKEEQAGICALGFSAGMSLANKEAACNNLVTKDYEPVCKQSYDAGRKLALGQDPGKAAPGAPDSSETEPDCDTTFTNPLSWILCPVMHGGAKFTDFVFGSLVKPLLQSNPIGLDSDNGFYKAWQSFRNIANIMLIGILLIMVFSQLTEGWGLNVVDAYTAKKMAPRILIGVIAINLSIYLCIAAIDITNIIGSGIEYLLTQPFADAQVLQDAKLETNTESTVASGIGLSVAGGGAFALAKIGTISAAAGSIGTLLEGAFFFLVPFFIGMFFAGLAILVTLVIRFGLIVFLTIISPVAIACFILPGTEKYFKSWWNLFLKTLFVYPIIAVIFAMSDIMAVIFVQNSNEINDAAGLVSVLVGIIAVYMPLFLIPFAFKFAGGAIGAIAKIASDKSQGWAGKTKEAYDKNFVQNPDNFVYKRKANRKANLEDEGLTKGQITSGLTRGWKGMRQSRKGGESLRQSLNRFGEAGQEDIESSRQGFLRARKEELMKTKEGVQMAGNEDPFIAYRHAANTLPNGNDEELRQSMEQFLQNPSNVDGREYTADQARQYATNMTKLAERTNRKTMLGLTTDQISGSGTGYKMDLTKGKLGGLSEAIADIVDDNDAGRNTQDVVSGALSARALGTQAERPDFAASPSVTIAVATKFSEAAQRLGPNWRQTDEGKTILAQGHDMIVENVFEGKTASELVRGKAEGVTIIEKYASKRLNEAMSDYKAGKTSVNPRTGAVMDAETTFKAKIAPYQKLHDALNYASGKNAEIIGSGVMGEKFEFGDKVTSIGAIMDELADDPVYKQFHKGWGSSGGSGVVGGGNPGQMEITDAGGQKVNWNTPTKSAMDSLNEYTVDRSRRAQVEGQRELNKRLEEANRRREEEEKQKGPQGPLG